MRLLFFALLFGICAAKELGLYHENILGLDVYVMSVKERPIDTSILVVDDKDRDKYKSKYSVNQQNIMLMPYSFHKNGISYLDIMLSY